VLHGDWAGLRAAGPFALLVLDDFTASPGWPPTYLGRPDAARLYWLQHPDLLAAEIHADPGTATIVASFTG
jgi:hypothetical protein